MSKQLSATDSVSKHMSKLIERMDSACQTQGWESDQGTGKSVDNALEEYQDSVHAMVTYTNRIIKERDKYKKLDEWNRAGMGDIML